MMSIVDEAFRFPFDKVKYQGVESCPAECALGEAEGANYGAFFKRVLSTVGRFDGERRLTHENAENCHAQGVFCRRTKLWEHIRGSRHDCRAGQANPAPSAYPANI